MPSSYDSSTSSIEIMDATYPRSARALVTDAANMGSSTTVAGVVAAPTLSGTKAEDYASSLRGQRAVDDLCRKHGVPKVYTAQPAGERRACTPPPEGAVCVYAHALEAGMRVPLHGFFSKVHTHFCLAPSQITPNGWRILAGFVELCHDAGVPLSVAVFRHFFSLGTYAILRGWYFFGAKKAAGTLFTGLPESNKGWKETFFFLTSPEPWPCPVRWGEPPSQADPVLTSQQCKSVAKLIDARVAHGTAFDLRTYLRQNNLDAAFSSSLAGESPLPPASSRPTFTRAKGTYQSAKKAVASASRSEKVKSESGGDTSALSGKKRHREEANSNDLPCQSELSSLPAHHGCSATCLCVPPGFDPKPRQLPVPDAHDVAGKKVNYASSYALELDKKLAEQIATRAELEKKLVVQDAEVLALRRNLKQDMAGPEHSKFAAAVQQVLVPWPGCSSLGCRNRSRGGRRCSSS
ncbi:hypothetical protein ACQ4PT_009047 [Festuca glaucescens]